MPVRPGRQGRPRTAFVLGQTRPKGPKGLPWFGSVRLLLLLRSKRRVAPLPHPSLRAGRRQVRLKPLWPRGALGVGCWNTETSTTRCAARLLSAVTASRMVIFTSLNTALRSGAVDFGALGPRALGGAGSPPNLAPGRWVLGRKYLRGQASDLITKNGCGIAEAHTTLPEERSTIGVGRFLGVGCSVGVGSRGRWVFKRGYLDDGASDLDSETCPGIARGHNIFPEQGLPTPRCRFLGVGWRRVTPKALGPRALGV